MKTGPDITLSAAAQGTARYSDHRCGFTMLIPGEPELSAPASSSTALAPDALVRVRSLPIALSFRLDSRPAAKASAAQAAALALAYAQHHGRPGQEPAVRAAGLAQSQRWAVVAAASCIYPLPAPDAHGSDQEEVVVLCQDDATMLLSKRFRASQVPGLQWTLFNTAAMSTVRWDQSGADPPPDLIWPDSTFLQPGLSPVLCAARQVLATRWRPLFAAAGGRLAELGERAEQLLYGSEPPSHRIDDAERLQYQQFLGEVCQSAMQELALGEGLREVRSAQDLRGFLLLLLHVLGRFEATFAPAQPSSAPTPFVID